MRQEKAMNLEIEKKQFVWKLQSIELELEYLQAPMVQWMLGLEPHFKVLLYFHWY